MADELFNQADLNKDQRLDLNEFRNLLAQNLGLRSVNFAANTTGGDQYTASSYESSSSSGAYGGIAGLAEATSNVAGVGGGETSYSSYEQSSYTSASGVETGGFDLAGLQANKLSNVGLTTDTVGGLSSSTFEASSLQQQLQVDPDNPQNLYYDPNPQIIRRPPQSGQLTYTQNVKVRFLQPPALPPPGPLIIKEVRPPQPPPPPPLRIRQLAPPLPQPLPLVLRERPPQPPVFVASETVIRRLAALPVPPRSIIIERLPPLPPKPRDIIIERWIPYGPQAKRKTIVQRAAAAKQYPKPRNIIIIYEPIQVRVLRQFQRFAITRENPQVYIQRYGQSLLDSQTLVQQARAAGVIEDISPPNNFATATASSSSFSASSGIETLGGINLVGSGNGGASQSSFESSSNSGDQQGSASFSSSEVVQGVGLASSGFSSQSGVEGAFGGAGIYGANTTGYESYSASAGGVNNNDTDPVTTAFITADLNKDGTLDPHEFRQFLSSQLRFQQ